MRIVVKYVFHQILLDKIKKVTWVGHVACMRYVKNVCTKI
jgi:hypothetical protein